MQPRLFRLKKILWLSVLCLLFSLQTFSQTSFSLQGKVVDAKTGEPLYEANVFFKETLQGEATDEDGKFLIRETAGTYTLMCSYLGYEPYSDIVILGKDMTVLIELHEIAVSASLVEITGKREDANVQSAKVGLIDLPMKRVEVIPVLFGETDILKTIQLLPGIQSGGEGSNTFYVRGGGSDQNMILLDGATVYNPSHAAGFFSVFNADVINSAEIYKGGLAPEYGGRMSSVLNITTLDGDMERYKAKIGVGLLSSHVQVEGPIQREKSSFAFAARRTYADVIMSPFIKNTAFEGIGCYFYDLNGKLTFRLSKKDVLSLTGYYGKDLFKFADDDRTYGYNINWSNGIGALKWNHLFTNNLSLGVSTAISDYQMNLSGEEQAYSMQMLSAIRDYKGDIHLLWQPDSSNVFKVGASYIFHRFHPSAIEASSLNTDFDLGDAAKWYAHDAAVYAQDEWTPISWLKIIGGLRYNYFAQIGPFTRYIIDDIYNFNNVDSVVYGKGEVVAPYHLFEPRVNIRFKTSKNGSIKTSYTLNNQCLNLAAISDMSLPTDVWFPATDLIKPQKSHQVSLGYFHNFLDNSVETSVEFYYKKMYNLLEMHPDVNMLNAISSNMDYVFTSGEGQSYGMELFANKTVGKFTGWVAYTLSWTTRTFDEILEGKTFYARHDRRHDVSVLLNYILNDKWNFSLVWVYSSGNAYTIPNSFYIINGNVMIEYGEHNAWRMPSYHRLDLSANWNVFDLRRVSGTLNFSIYNAYNRKNPYFITYTMDGSLASGYMKISARQVSIFPILPSIAFNVQFK